jgi:hypothetical protein
VLYLLKVDALIVASVFGAAGFLIAALFVIEQVQGLLEAHRFFARSFAISRSFSRNVGREPAFRHRFQ